MGAWSMLFFVGKKTARNLIPETVWTRRRRALETLLPGRQNVCVSCMPTTPSTS